MKNKKILVVMGGVSTEREVSLRSGEAVFNALHRLGYNAEKFVLDESNAGEIIAKKPDLCVPVLHGKGGEDGTIQGLLELAGIPYTGSGVASSANCMNKVLTKKMLSVEEVPTPDFAHIRQGDDIAESIEDIVAGFDFPLVVKAPCQGSSVGVEIVHNEAELSRAIDTNMKLDGEILVERFIKGTELTVPVMQEGDEVKTLPIIEIVSENTFYDFESKYTSGMSHHIIPARISKNAAELIEYYAKEAYIALSCRGVARVDFFLDEEDNPYVIEINTIPGMTATSLVPDSAKAAGLSFDDLVEKMVLSAL